MTHEERIRRRKIRTRRRVAVNVVIAVLVSVVTAAITLAHCSAKAPEPVVVEVEKEHLFDTSIIENQWCGDFIEGHIRLLGGWKYGEGTVQDEQGNVWETDADVTEADFLLLWIADHGTPDKVDDDVLVKVWREAL